MTEILKTVLPVIIMLMLGVLTRRLGMLTRGGVDALKRVVMDITLPAVLLGAFSKAEYTLSSALLPLVMFGACLLALGLGIVGKRMLKIALPFAPFLATGYEAGMLGYALFAMLYGSEHTASFALLDLGQVFFVFTVYKALLKRCQGGKMTVRETAASLGSSPTIWAIAVGVLLGATGIYKGMSAWGANVVFDAVTDFVAQPTAAVILIAIGYDLSINPAQIKSALSTILMRLGICAVLMAAMLVISGIMFPADEYIRGSVILMFMLPPPYVLPIIADDASQREYVSASLCALTLFTIVGFAVMALF